MPPADEPGRRYRSPRHGEPDPRWGGPAAVAPAEDDPYGDVTGERPSVGRHGTPDDDGRRHDDGWSSRPRRGGSELPGRFDRPDDPLGGHSSGSWSPPPGGPSSRFGPEDSGPASGPPPYGRPGPPPGGSPYGQAPPSPPYGQAPPSPPYGQAPPSPPYGQASSGPSYGRPPNGTPYGPPAPHGPGPSSPYGQAPPSPPYGQSSPRGPAPTGPNGHGAPNGAPNPTGPDPRHGGARTGEDAPAAAERGVPARGGTAGPGGTAVQPPVDARPAGSAPLLAGGIPPPARDRTDGAAAPPGAAASDTGSAPSADGATDDADEPGTTVMGDPARHRRGGASGPARDADADDTSGPGRRSRKRAEEREPAGKKKRKGSFWRELPLLVVVAIVLTFVIQTFVARIYVIPSASMEQTLHGCDGCANDRVAVDKVSYRFGDPAPGDVVVFKGPPAWLDNDEVGETQPSSNPLVRGFQDALSLVGLAAPNEKDFVKRVIATGGQTVACCDAGNHVLVDGRPITEPYLYYQPGLGDKQATFDPVRVPDGQLWVMGDNRNNSADARFHGPVPVSDVIGKVRVVVLPISRWRTVPSIDPQTPVAALGATGWGVPVGTGTAGAAAGALLAVPVVGAGRRLRRAVAADATTAAPPRPDPVGGGDAPTVAEADRE